MECRGPLGCGGARKGKALPLRVVAMFGVSGEGKGRKLMSIDCTHRYMGGFGYLSVNLVGQEGVNV